MLGRTYVYKSESKEKTLWQRFYSNLGFSRYWIEENGKQYKVFEWNPEFLNLKTRKFDVFSLKA